MKPPQKLQRETFVEQMREFLRRNFNWFLAAGFALLLLQDIFGTHGVLAMRRTQQEAAKLEQAARESGADALICTEKDVFNLRDVTFSLFPVGFARIAMRVSESDNFWRMVLGIAEHRRVKTAS